MNHLQAILQASTTRTIKKYYYLKWILHKGWNASWMCIYDTVRNTMIKTRTGLGR